MTFGLSRDDVEARPLPRYRSLGLIDDNPFEVLDQVAVGTSFPLRSQMLETRSLQSTLASAVNTPANPVRLRSSLAGCTR